MYIPKHFEIKDEEIIYDIIEKNSFATLFSQHEGHPYATHLPLILNKKEKYLHSHFAKPNTQWKYIEGQEVLAIFHGAHSYISSSWYETNKSVPTWNYVVVHVYGKVEIVEGEEMMESLQEMVLKYETPNSTYQFDQLDTSFLDNQAKGIIGFKMKIEKIEAKAKLSQHHSAERLNLVVSELEQSPHDNDREIAALMKTILKKKQENNK